MSYVVVWEFQVRSGCEEEFERVYGAEGDWVQLFRQAQGFVRTDLLRDHTQADRYLVLDYWDSPELYDAFRSTNAGAYSELDKRCVALTMAEKPVGSFTTLE